MDRAEHAANLRRAMAQAGLTNGDVATALGVSVRTVVNWISRNEPTVPNDRMQAALSRLLPGYADGGDPVEVAIARADMAPFRRSELLAMYQRLLHEQGIEDKNAG
jgi:N-acetylglucosamine kinase-like BadF-type ATPase